MIKYKKQNMAVVLIFTGLILLTACQSNTSSSDSSLDSDSSENELSLSTEENSESEISTDEYSYEELEDGTLKLTAYHPSEPLAEGDILSVPEEIDGKKITVIGEGCFSDKEAFDGGGWNSIIILPEGITTIENYVVNSSFKQIEIPDSVTEIKEAAFLRIANDGSQVPISTLIISCSKDSAAESYAKNQGIRYTYTGEDWSEDGAFKEEFERQDVMGWTITGEEGKDSFKYYGQYRMEGTYTDFCVVAYCNDWFGFVYDIVVLDKETGEELQRIPLVNMFSGNTYYNDGLITETDADFDGEPEILMYRGVTGNQCAAFYFCYDWEEGLQSYVENESFRPIWNPVIDAEEQVVRGTSRGSATTHYYYTYAFIDGEFVEIEEVYSEFVDIEDVYSEFTSDKEEKVEILETYHFVDGKRVLVEKVIRSNVYDEDGNQIGTTEEQVDLEEN